MLQVEWIKNSFFLYLKQLRKSENLPNSNSKMFQIVLFSYKYSNIKNIIIYLPKNIYLRFFYN